MRKLKNVGFVAGFTKFSWISDLMKLVLEYIRWFGFLAGFMYITYLFPDQYFTPLILGNSIEYPAFHNQRILQVFILLVTFQMFFTIVLYFKSWYSFVVNLLLVCVLNWLIVHFGISAMKLFVGILICLFIKVFSSIIGKGRAVYGKNNWGHRDSD